jgi:hypothetical protein
MVCCSFFDNGEIFYTGSEFGTDYFIADPLFCDTANGDYSIADNSSCAPAHSPCGQLIGKYGVNCTAEYICGDANRGGDVNISDAVFIINYVFVSGSPWPSPMQAADVNCVGSANVSDAVYIINYIFVGGNAPCDTNGDGQPDC